MNLQNHIFKTKNEHLSKCEKCGLEIGTEWVLKFLEEHRFLEIN
jgi:hypothetical protein